MTIKQLVFQAVIYLILILPFKSINFAETQQKEFVTIGLVRNGAIYTLLGDKPISLFMYESLPRWNLELIYSLSNKFIWELFGWIRPEECLKQEDVVNWKCWKHKYRLNSSNFCLVEEVNKGEICATLINKSLVRKILIENYDLFAVHSGKSFDVDTVIEKIHDSKSFFWTNIMYSEVSPYPHVALGLLYGFGRENSVAFQKFIDAKETFEDGTFSNEVVEKMTFGEMDIQFIIPQYRLFSDPDPVLEHYKQERARIQKEYKDADLRKLFIDAFEK